MCASTCLHTRYELACALNVRETLYNTTNLNRGKTKTRKRENDKRDKEIVRKIFTKIPPHASRNLYTTNV